MTTDTTLWDELRAAVRGDVHTDELSRALYATDASIYQIAPRAVVLPIDQTDITALLRLVRRHRVPLLPRGGGTSLAGQTVGPAIQIDFSKHLNRVIEVNPAEGSAWVEPGIVLDELNAQLAPHGLIFAPDVSPSNRATVGGMIGNNSSGMYSIVYGKTIDHVLALRVVLSDGSVVTFGPLGPAELDEKLRLDTLEGRCYRAVRRLARAHAGEIAQRYPKVMRRVGGYNLDAFIEEPQAQGAGTFNLSHLVVGSEGTLAIVLAAKLRLVPRPKHSAIGILAFATLDDALDAVVPCLECRPAAVELMDEILLDLTRRSREYAHYLASFVQGEPGGLLQVEFFGETPEAAAAELDRLERHVRERLHRPGVATENTEITEGVPFQFSRCLTAEQKRAVLHVRKASLPLLMSLSPDRKPETFVEDSAVPPERLGAYIRRFRAICHDHGVQVAIYGHASVGLIHARPLLNLKDAGDVRTMRSIAEAIKDLVIAFGGALSGEHGDGLARSEFNRELFGDALYAAFGEIKHTFDPLGLLNPGKIVDAPPMDTHLRYGAGYRTIPLQMHFRFADTGGMAGAAELCNGNGLCRKIGGGTMCPSYMVTRDEEHSTRGRANALRMVLSGALPAEALTGRRMHDVMDLCVECKGCTGECPSRVNMTRLKAEWLSRYYQEHGVPLRSRLFGNIRQLSELGSRLAPLSNLALRLPGLPWLQEYLLGISRHRRLPEFAAEPFQRWFSKRDVDAPDSTGIVRRPASTVVLFPDTFTNYNEPWIGRAAVQVLEAARYKVLLPRRAVCCGRPLISKGLLTQAKDLARAQLDWLAPYAAAGLPIVGLEPSCILTFRDEYPDLLDDPRAAALARNSFLIDEFLAGEVRAGRSSLDFRAVDRQPVRDDSDRSSRVSSRTYLFHGHCHQKALSGTAHALELLRCIPGATVHEVDSGCCGMAGSFGYETEHFAISQKMGERALFPAVRALPPEGVVVAMGTSCRQQIRGGTGRRPRHLVEVLAEALLLGDG
jgi:FAD/FMN-containing dehydrogenase/Fe-S oxidoreductase